MPPGLAGEYDVVVAGSGAAGLTAALTCALRGLRTVVIEAAETFGGATAYSGGAVWIPASRQQADRGVDDSVERARRYLEATVGDTVSVARREAYLRAGPAMIEEFERRTAWVRWTPVSIPDYRPEAPGGEPRGRALEAAVIDGRALGAELARLRPAPPAVDVKGLTVTADDFIALTMVTRTAAGRRAAARVVARYLSSRLRGRRLLGIGQALTARLRLATRDAGVPLICRTPLLGLVSAGDRVCGARVRRPDGTEVEVRARRGVVLAAGGFSRNQALREQHLPAPTSAAWSLAPPDGQDGSGIGAGLAVGAAVRNLDVVWGMPSALIPDRQGGRAPMMTLSERALPGTIVVNSHGRRFANEAMNYDDFTAALYDADDVAGARTVPSWLMFDQRAKDRYVFLAVMPRRPFPRRFLQEGHVQRAPDLTELARTIGVPADALADTVTRFNQAARLGVDPDLHRGESAYDQFYGDPTLPAPNLAPLDQPPFYAVRIYPGDLGTKGGLDVDEHSRVLRPDGGVIAGLYAAGNCSAGVMGRNYPGPGATLGSAMVAGYLAGLHLAGAPSSNRPSR